MRIDVVQEEHIRSAAGMPLVLGGLGLRSAVRQLGRLSADGLLQTSRCGHPIREFGRRGAASAVWLLTRTMGFEPPSWRALAEGARHENVEPVDLEPGSVRRGCEQQVTST